MAEKRTALLALLLCAAFLCAACGGPEAPAPTAVPESTPAPAPVSVSPSGREVLRREGEAYYPAQDQWRYHFVYAYPIVQGDDYASAAISETYQMALDEVTQLTLPMFAAEESTAGTRSEVRHDFYVTCNNDRLLSIVQTRSQTGAEGAVLAVEPLVFDVSGVYTASTPITLRGCILAGVSAENADDMTAEKYPQAAKILAGSSDSIGERVAEKLYPEFLKLQESGVGRADVAAEDFEWEFSPTTSFYVNEDGCVVFFFPPELLAEPSLDVPAFPFTAAQIEDLL